MLKEFKEFATRGNIFDMAIGIIIGGAFQKIVTSLVNDIVMPTISIITGKVDFSTLEFTIGDISIKYGNFITSIKGQSLSTSYIPMTYLQAVILGLFLLYIIYTKINN